MLDEPLETIETRAEALVRNDRELLAALVKMREDHSLRQEDVAERMGVSQSTVSTFERYDNNPTLANLRRYAMAIGARITSTVVDDTSDAPQEEPDWTSRRNVVAQRNQPRRARSCEHGSFGPKSYRRSTARSR
ncbi:helix-turn-helix domain-containing protein [Rathayibacter rathayi]|uniref:helix-turn-helix domain-containing protein n=1 Tax=Rathayibacter rathayi TaxID=33887 RepID=UPI000CE8B2B8|nr:helix-turn-helix transcriptional regulator [Rathayibacter rathayi]PPG85006.1 XRE family transcriptional regulator [Rathayibacter rathayi]